MRFIAFHRSAHPSPPSPKQMEDMMKFINEALKAKVLVVTEGFGPSTAADAKVRMTGASFSVVDGPFTEAKEAIGGFAIMQVKSREEMIDWTKRFLAIVGDGESEIRQLVEMSPIEMARGQRS